VRFRSQGRRSPSVEVGYGAEVRASKAWRKLGSGTGHQGPWHGNRGRGAAVRLRHQEAGVWLLGRALIFGSRSPVPHL
jgi:hypothetical protein